MANYKCLSTCDKSEFCFVCAKYTAVKKRVKINATFIERYKKAYDVKNIKNLNKQWTPNIVCSICYRSVSSTSKSKYATPAIWKRPKPDHSNCYICQTNLSKIEKSLKSKNYQYRTDLSVKLPQKVKKNLGDFEDSDDETVMNGKTNHKSNSESE